jgi:hypothetical protein
MSAHDPRDNPNKTYRVKAGDRRPVLTIQLLDENGDPKDLLDYFAPEEGPTDQIKLTVAAVVGGRRLIDQKNMSIFTAENAAAGKVSYEWEPDELVPGDYLMEVVLDPGGPLQEAFPKKAYYKLIVLPRL